MVASTTIANSPSAKTSMRVNETPGTISAPAILAKVVNASAAKTSLAAVIAVSLVGVCIASFFRVVFLRRTSSASTIRQYCLLWVLVFTHLDKLEIPLHQSRSVQYIDFSIQITSRSQIPVTPE